MLTNEDLAKFNTLRARLNKRQIKENEFFDEFLKIMKNVSLKSAYEIFPHYLRTIINEDIKQELNEVFVRALKKLPSKEQSLLNKCEHYSDLFKLLVHEIEKNI